MNTTNGKIAEQSKEKLIKALLVIMEQYDFKEITITQLSQEAGLSRKTFYRLFKDKEELINFFFEKLYKEFLIQRVFLNWRNIRGIKFCFRHQLS